MLQVLYFSAAHSKMRESALFGINFPLIQHLIDFICQSGGLYGQAVIR